ncbi:MAG: MFS transporter [Chitinophagia bacterium]|jgi:nucleoside transporter|nr:MFS transporter [Chitinophagia bacterium]
MKSITKIQLSLMMFMQFFVWGAWYGQMSKYMTDQLHATGDQVGNAYAAFSIAMVVAPFFVGMLADRFFQAQKVLGFLNLAGAAILFILINIKDPDSFYWVMLLYCLTFAPTIALTSSISMRQMQNPEKEFPAIRVFGTIAWIVVVNLVGFMGVGDKVTIFQISMVSAAILGVMSFLLPATPPTATGPSTFSQIIGKDAFVLFKDRSFLIFFISSVLICIPLSFYYTWANPSLTDGYKLAFPGMDPTSFKVENKMSLGQVSEVLFMLLLPLAYARLGVKKILIVGLIAWIIRFAFFGYGNPATSEWMLYAAILLHGVCYDFFFVSGMIYTDAKAGEKIKSQAQGLITLATYGIGMLIGSIAAGKVKDAYTVNEVTNWLNVWLVPAGIAAVILVLFLLFFKDNTRTAK